jgi:hypothetical protein
MNFWSFIFLLICIGILFAYPKQIISLASIGAVIYYAFVVNEKNILNNVKINIKYDEGKCTKTHPLFVEILNHSNKTVYETRVGIAAYIPGYSNNIVKSEPTFSTDKIIGKNQSYFFCEKLPNFNQHSNIFDRETLKEAAKAELTRRQNKSKERAKLQNAENFKERKPFSESLKENSLSEKEARKAEIAAILESALGTPKAPADITWPGTLIYKIIYKGIKLVNDKYIYENSN